VRLRTTLAMGASGSVYASSALHFMRLLRTLFHRQQRLQWYFDYAARCVVLGTVYCGLGLVCEEVSVKQCPVCGNALNIRGTCDNCGWAEQGTRYPKLLGLHFFTWVGLLIAGMGQLVYHGLCAGDEYGRAFGSILVVWPSLALGAIFVLMGVLMSYYGRRDD
jgi:hypothetical protein